MKSFGYWGNFSKVFVRTKTKSNNKVFVSSKFNSHLCQKLFNQIIFHKLFQLNRVNLKRSQSFLWHFQTFSSISEKKLEALQKLLLINVINMRFRFYRNRLEIIFKRRKDKEERILENSWTEYRKCLRINFAASSLWSWPSKISIFLIYHRSRKESAYSL